MGAPSFSIDRRRSFALFAGFENQGAHAVRVRSVVVVRIAVAVHVREIARGQSGRAQKLSLQFSFHLLFGEDFS